MPASKIETSTPITTYYIKKTDGTNTSIRKLSDDLAKKKLSSVDPIEIEHRFSVNRKGSVGSDSHWPGWADHRRLSEAGVRRSSDSSIVLTEDTDSFIIGDRVYVGGNKPGQIAYIGETQFAPGDWAGIVLDQPIGKNDGSVGGVRYFQCESKRGIFSRLTRLTRKPLFGFGESEIEKSHAPTVTFSSTSPRPSISSNRSSVSSPTSPTSKTSIGGSVAKNGELKVGDRVIVMSSMGSKAGMLRYLGPTDFAAGEWCGVELDDPLGKNDGSVAGRRYFDCLPNFGLFAPIHKVSKSPSGNRKPSTPSCAMHPTGSGYKKHHSGSRESLNSTTTTATASSIKSASRRPSSVRTTPVSNAGSQNKTPLQELLQQKQQHIEQLLKERDLERAEVTRAASQADQAEHELAVMRQDFLQFREETAAKTNDYELMLTQLKVEKQELTNILEDERRRYEDLQFRYEEESITRADLEARLSKTEEKLKELENQDRLNQETLEIESNKLFVAEEALTKLKEEYEVIRQKLNDLGHQRTNENETLRAEAKSKLTEQTKSLEDKVKELEQLKEKYIILEEKNNNLNKSRVELEEQIKKNNLKYEQDTKGLGNELDKMKLELRESEKKRLTLEDKITELTTQITAHKFSESKQIENNLMNENRYHELEEKLKQAQKIIDDKDIIINSVAKDKDNELHELNRKLENQLSILNNKEEKFLSGLEELRAKLNEKEKENEYLKKTKLEMENTLTEKSKVLHAKVVDVNSKLLQYEKEKEDSNGIINSLNLKLKENEVEKTQMEQKCKEEESKLKEELDKLQTTFKNSYGDFENRHQTVLGDLKLKESQLSVATDSLRKLEREHDDLKGKLESLSKDNVILSHQLSLLNKSSEEKHKDALNERNKLLNDVTVKDDLINKLKQSEEGKETQINELKQHLSTSNKKMSDLELKIGDLTSQLNNATEKCSQLSSQKVKLEEDIAALMNNSSDSSTQLSKLNDELRLKESELDKLKEHLNEQKRIAANKEQIMKIQYEEVVNKLSESNAMVTQIQNELKEKNESLNKLSKEIEILNEREKSSKEKFLTIEKEKEEEIKKLRLKDDQQKTIILNLEKVKGLDDETIKENEGKINNAQKIENELRATIEILEVDCKNYKKEIDSMLKDKVILEEKLKNQANIFLEKEKQFNELSQSKDKSYENFSNEKKILENQINDLKKEIEMSNEVLTSKNSEITEIAQERDLLKKDNVLIRDQLSDKDNKLSDVFEELEQIKESLLKNKDNSNNIESKLNAENSRLKSEKEKLNDLLTVKESEFHAVLSELEKLQEEKKQFEKVINEKECLIENQNKNLGGLNNDTDVLKNELKQLNNEKMTLIENLKESTNQIEKLKQNEEILKKSSYEEVNRLKEENSFLANKVNQAEQMFSSDYEKAVQKLAYEQQKMKELNDNLVKSELDQVMLRNTIKTLEDNLKEKDETKNSFLTEYKSAVENYEKVISDKDKQLINLKNELSSLRTEKDSSIQNKLYAESLEREKKILEEKVTKLQSQPQSSHIPSSSNNNAAPVSNSTVHAAAAGASVEEQNEETEMLHGQINFLNSIIVDLQNKNDVLQGRIVQLETGEPDQTSLNGIKTRTVAPRLFCDICDVFDAHDTEDCPTQSSNSPVPEQKHSFPRGYVRPYCDNCEMFGHETADCVEDETF